MRKNNPYKTIFWDFDGVILNSMDVRDKGFELVLTDYPKHQVDALLSFHRVNGGLSRYVKFRYFFEVIRNESITDIQLKGLTDRFSGVMLRELTDKALLIEDSATYIANNYKVISMYIVSGSDQHELRLLCKALDIAKYFNGIFGSPTPKNELVKNLVKSENFDLSTVVLIGDSINDFEAANANGVDFCGYNNLALKTLKTPYLNYISELDSVGKK